MTPASQKDRPISFVLLEDGKPIAEQDLIIRPEELTRREPSRNNTQQTMGGTWLDSFGQGVADITLSGITGWRGTATEDGATLFKNLRDTVFTQWHTARAQRLRRLQDPDVVQLVLADQLNDLTSVVAPMQFQLRRHKSRPLLSQFQISLSELGPFDSVVATQLDSIVEAIDNPRRQKLAQDSLQQNMVNSTGLLVDVSQGIAGITSPIADAATRALELSTTLLTKVDEVADNVVDAVDTASYPLLAAASDFQRASANAFAILATPSNIGAHAKYTLMRIAGNFLDGYCNLRNGFRRLFEFPDFSDLFGASTCSSTGGGRPYSRWAQENPFLQVFPNSTPNVAVNSAAQTSIDALVSLDPLDAGDLSADVVRHMRNITGGIAVA